MFDIIKKKWIFFGISIALCLISIISLVFQGFNLDTDFSGGIALTYEIVGDFSTEEISRLVDEAIEGKKASSIQKSGSDVIIKIGYDKDISDDDRITYSETVKAGITAALEEKFGAPVVDSTAVAETAADTEETDSLAAEEEEAVLDETTTDADVTENTEATEATEGTEATEATEATENETAADVSEDADADTTDSEEASATGTLLSGVRLKTLDDISPSSGQELARSALWMSLLACAGILIYVTIRFEFTSGCVAIIALIHDVLILLGIYSLFRVSVNINFIAAVLTVLGYSINNTIVIMDRIRENTRHSRKETYGEIANGSIWQTMNRSINTTITTLLTIGMVYIIGVSSIKAFALPIIIGIVIGFYSSVFVTGPLWATWRDSAVKAKKNNAPVASKNSKKKK